MVKDFGATLVEYAIILALLVIVCVVAVQYLDAEARDEMKDVSSCTAVVPGSPEAAGCGYRIVTTSP